MPSAKPVPPISHPRRAGLEARCRSDYDDGGFSGGTMERPALQRLLAGH